MEVHHHPNVDKKNFKDYFLEFLMIFLAVTMGFFAESFREYIVNKEHEKQYVSSFYDDLLNDQKNLPRLINSIEQQQLQPAASLPVLFSKTGISDPADSIYFYLRKFIRQQGIRAFITDRTYEQIKNAGEMRLIANKQIADSLIDYYKEIGFIDYLQQTLLGYKAKLFDNLPLIFRSADYALAIDSVNYVIIPHDHIYLLNSDPLVVNRLLIEVNDVGALSHDIKRLTVDVLRKNNEIKKLIKANYKAENN
jgi:hypothetical protein